MDYKTRRKFGNDLEIQVGLSILMKGINYEDND